MRRQHFLLTAVAAILVTAWLLRGSWLGGGAEVGAAAVVRESEEVASPEGAEQQEGESLLAERETGSRSVVDPAGSSGKASEGEPLKAELTGRIVLGGSSLAPMTFIVRCESLGNTPEDRYLRRNVLRVNNFVGPGEEYRFEDLPLGKYSVQVSPAIPVFRPEWDDWVLSEKHVLLVPGRNRVDLLIDPIDVRQFLQLQCFNPQGQPVQAEGIQFRMRTTLGWVRSPFPRRLPLKGGADLVELPEGWLRPDEARDGIDLLILVASHGEYSSASLELRADERQAVLRFAEPADLELRIEGVPARLQGRFRARVEPASQVGLTNPMTEIGPQQGEDGVFRFDRLEVGANIVHVYLHRGETINSYRRTLVGTHALEIAAGTQVLTIPCPELYDVAVRNPGGWAGREIILERVVAPGSSSSERPQSAKLSADLRLDFLDCPAGDYLVQCGMLALPITVPCGEVLLPD